MASTGVFTFENDIARVAGIEIPMAMRTRPIFIALCESQYAPIHKSDLFFKVYPERIGTPITAKDIAILSSNISKLRTQINDAIPKKQYGLLIEDFVGGATKIAKSFGKNAFLFGNLRFDLETGFLQQKKIEGQHTKYVPVKLGLIQKRLLAFLILHKEESVSHQDIYDFVYHDYGAVGLDTKPAAWPARLTGLMSDMRDVLDGADKGTSAFIETTPGGYRFTLTPDLMNARRDNAVLAHEDSLDEEDETAIHLGDLVLSAKSRVAMSVDPPQGEHERRVILSRGARKLLLLLCQPEKYDRYLHVSEIYTGLTGKTDRGYIAQRYMRFAKELADKINPKLNEPFIHVELAANRIAASLEKPELSLEIIRINVRAGVAKPFNGNTRLATYQSLDFDVSSHAIRNVADRESRANVEYLDDTAGRLLEHLLVNPTQPKNTRDVAKAMGTTFESLRSGHIMKDLDCALEKIGLKGVLFTTPSSSHIMLDFSPSPILNPTMRRIEIRPKSETSSGSKVEFKPWQRQTIKLMQQAGGQVCRDSINADTSPVAVTSKGPIKLSDASPEVFASLMNGLSQKLAARAESELAVFRNYSGCYRFGPNIAFHL